MLRLRVLRAPCSALRAPRSALEGPLGLSTNAPSLSIETGGDYDAKLSSRSCSALEGSPSSSANAPSLPTETGGDCDAELSSPLPSSPPSIRRVAAALPLDLVQFCSIQQRLPPCGHCTVVDELVLAAQNGDETTIKKLATFINFLGTNQRTVGASCYLIRGMSRGCPDTDSQWGGRCRSHGPL